MKRHGYITLLLAILAGLSASAQKYGSGRGKMPRLMELPPFDRAILLIKHFEMLHGPSDWPYIGYGHRVLPNERFELPLTHRQADSLLRKDLLGRCAIFRRFGKDSLLLATLSYQVGEARLLGNGKIPKSNLIRRLEAGNRNIYHEYVSFRKWKGKVVPSIERRRWLEFYFLHVP